MATAVALQTNFGIERLAGSLGAAIVGLDLAKPIEAGTMVRLRQAFLDHLVLVFPGQAHITPEEQVAFARLWGPLHIAPGGYVPGNAALIEIASRGARRGSDDPNAPENHPSARLARTDIWHSDLTYDVKPPLGSLLFAREIPAIGGDTMFANQYLAYETLSGGMQRLLESVRAVHSGEGHFRLVGRDPAEAPRTAHPVVRTHPETRRKALYVNRVWVQHLEGMTPDESEPLLAFLYAHAVRPEFTFRHRWSAGDLLMWDNRCVQHNAIQDYGDATRVMHRATVLGDAPF